MAGAFVAYAVLDSWLMTDPAQFRPVLLVSESLLVLPGLYFGKLLRELQVPRLRHDPMRWVSAGALLYLLGRLLIGPIQQLRAASLFDGAEPVGVVGACAAVERALRLLRHGAGAAPDTCGRPHRRPSRTMRFAPGNATPRPASIWPVELQGNARGICNSAGRSSERCSCRNQLKASW